jgi:hypothetical protein
VVRSLLTAAAINALSEGRIDQNKPGDGDSNENPEKISHNTLHSLKMTPAPQQIEIQIN